MRGVTCFTPDSTERRYTSDNGSVLGHRIEVEMAAIARALARALPQEAFEIETLKKLALFCGAGLLISLLMIMYDLDISAGFF
jgi:hypothetical protein